MPRTGAPLDAPARPRSARVAASALVVLLLAGGLVWYANSPRALPTSEQMTNANGTVGTPVYVGMFVPPGDFGRTLRLSGVKVHTTANTQVQVTPLLCRGGTLGVTTAPEQFCDELVDPEGETLRPGDAVVVEVTTAEPAIAVVDPVRLGFREGLQWGTRRAGSGAIVQLLGQPG